MSVKIEILQRVLKLFTSAVILPGFTGKMPEAAYHTLINTDLFYSAVFHDMFNHILSLPG
jgi:hypothetical protein